MKMQGLCRMGDLREETKGGEGEGQPVDRERTKMERLSPPRQPRKCLLTLSRPFLLFSFGAMDSRQNSDTSRQSLGLGGCGHSGQTKASLFLILPSLPLSSFV